jgi:hypothetical protein
VQLGLHLLKTEVGEENEWKAHREYTDPRVLEKSSHRLRPEMRIETNSTQKCFSKKDEREFDLSF